MGHFFKILKDKYLFLLFLISIFFVKFPPFYLLCNSSKFCVSHSVVKIIISFIFLIVLSNLIRRGKLTKLTKNPLIILVFANFFIQSTTIIQSIDISTFLKSYHNSLMVIIILFLSFYFSRNKNHFKLIDRFIYFTGTIFIIFELVALLLPDIFLRLYQFIFQKEVVDAFLININRGRIQFESDLEFFLPFFVAVLITKTKNNYKIINIILLFSGVAMSAFSNNRTRFVQLVFVLVSFFFLSKKMNLYKKIFLSICFILLILFSLNFSSSLNKFNVIDRFGLANSNDYQTVNFRINAFSKSIDFGLNHFFGIGLGNFYLINNNVKFIYSDSSSQTYHEEGSLSSHNIFSDIFVETGYLGFLTFITILLYIAKQDVDIFRNKNKNFIYKYIISSWAIFIYMLFNPGNQIYINGWFWFLRGIIISLSNR